MNPQRFFTGRVVGLLLVLVALVAVLAFVFFHNKALAPSLPHAVACTDEAKICPDGTAVGRTGPQCEFSQCPDVTTATSSDITLGIGQTGTFGNFKITLNSFVQDSRCPIDVQCIQAGAVNVNVTFMSGPHSETKNMPSDEVPQQFDEYHISIVKVAPSRESHRVIDPSAYFITFHITK